MTEGVSLAGVISEFFVSVSNNVTFPMLSFLAAGVVNFFVPSGGGQWAVQGPIMMPAGAAMGIENGRTAMAIAWGDQWTNMIQPFWALPALGIAKLSARDIMGYLVIVTAVCGRGGLPGLPGLGRLVLICFPGHSETQGVRGPSPHPFGPSGSLSKIPFGKLPDNLSLPIDEIRTL